MVRKATRGDKKLVLDILEKQFSEIPGTTWMLKKGKHRSRHIRNLLSFAFEKGLKCNGVYISHNQKGVAICFPEHQVKFSFKVFISELKFLLFSVPLSYLPKLQIIESHRNKCRSHHDDYLYFWFFAALKGGEDAGYELKHAIFELAETQHLPIYAETTVRKNKVVYERFGFETYHHWHSPFNKVDYWFMRYVPTQDKAALV